MYPCALRGYGPDIRMSGPFASLRSVQGANAPCAASRLSPYLLDRLSKDKRSQFLLKLKGDDHHEKITKTIKKRVCRGHRQAGVIVKSRSKETSLSAEWYQLHIPGQEHHLHGNTVPCCRSISPTSA